MNEPPPLQWGDVEAPAIDFRATAPTVTAEALSLVTITAQQLLTKQGEQVRKELDLAKLKEDIRVIQERTLPDAMVEAGMLEFKHDSGKKIAVKDIITGSPSKDNFPTALEWLKDFDHDDIVKRSISLLVNLPKGQYQAGNKIVAYIKKLKLFQGLGIVPKDEPTVNYQSFCKWAREMHAEHLEKHLVGGPRFVAHGQKHVGGEPNRPVKACEYCACPFCNEDTKKLLGIFVGKKAEVTDIKN